MDLIMFYLAYIVPDSGKAKLAYGKLDTLEEQFYCSFTTL